MILYTPLAITDIYPDISNTFENRTYIEYEGKLIAVDKNTDGSYQMIQLLSTDPQDFLNDNYAPGTIIK
ncbi:hypothetical protein CV093_09945 [Oceanobacillus sp. 143]|uniref:Uncharacterized protein n=1 Tax=Oceanobacillus zhaokaii TaxID=2052660 RepID=A0A345PGK5_9BACI|nr:YlzJ-like family protein [Oceanobacillus zhaokaii]AXI09135.1 hypothetical protein CUC15_09440 [Oceanobacillus zhaokaii]QGS68679.1 hypothetical protein CV093_09945 [Oceanobacillus sp. 143]